MNIHDEVFRTDALNVEDSFIVQAPAGSGKTELLTQRFLSLLSVVEKPEEILALTFTKKAAAEMKHRILSSLERATSHEKPQLPHEEKNWELAKAVLKRDEARNWDLLKNPARLQIKTLDALFASLTEAMPLLGTLGGQADILPFPQEAYEKAAEELLLHGEEKEIKDALSTLLEHCDNRIERVRDLLVELLEKREQWLMGVMYPHLGSLRILLEKNWENAIEAAFSKEKSFLHHLDELSPFIHFAKHYLEQGHPFQSWPYEALPPHSLHGLKDWQAIGRWLLTEAGEWRKTVTVKQGFPPLKEASSPKEKIEFQTMKEDFLSYLSSLKEIPYLQDALQQILRLPEPQYTESQWNVLSALLILLPRLVALLTLCFKEMGAVDFIAVSEAAFFALGDEEAPTELALRFDYQLKHLLVDEFQDTSFTQLGFLQKLTTGWQKGEGKTLFFVGDPMQSIYGFRQAEVGLFLKVREEGLGEMRLKPLQLSCNFRSTQELIHWINESFVNVMPKQHSMNEGAIAYTPSEALCSKGETSFVRWHVTGEDVAYEEQMIQEILNIQSLHPTYDIAILIRARRHGKNIIEALRREGIDYEAVDMEYLVDKSIIQDLLSLTTALFHLCDRVAWLSILRTPWVGLDLYDLAALTEEGDETIPLLAQLKQYKEKSVSKRGTKILERVLPIFLQSVESSQAWPLRQWVEDTFYALGGPACYDADSLLAASDYFDLLSQEESHFSMEAFKTHLQSLYAKNMSRTEHPVKIMTIHKAKGLEFDVVMVPELEKLGPPTPRSLLDWVEEVRPEGTDWLMAPIKAFDAEREPMSDFIRHRQQVKRTNELSRVLYVAATRAKEQLHWFFTLPSEKEDIKPAKGSFLEILWPLIPKDILRVELESHETNNEISIPCKNPLYALNPSWQLPKEVTWSISMSHENIHSKNQVVWQDPSPEIIGTVIHACLQQWGEEGIQAFTSQQLKGLLYFYGLPEIHLKKALQVLEETLHRIPSCPRAQWILKPHEKARTEYGIFGYLNEEWVEGILDRTFVDESGTRWIIDYKMTFLLDETTLPLEDFLDDQQARYESQLFRYAELMALQENGPIMLGLYFPRISAWRAWAFR